jgi:nitrite reductase/ring-hydroxylating ferredoxin subunit
MKRYAVARSNDIPDGERLIVKVNGHSIGIFHVDGRYHAFLNRCPHQGAELCVGRVVSHITSAQPGQLSVDSSRRYLVCPWHGWEFDLDTGQSYFDPARMRARRYSVELEPGSALAAPEQPTPGESRAKGPYIAEKLPVSVEDDYIIIVMP